MTTIDQTAFARLESEGRLLNPVFKGATRSAGRFGFRGELALRFAPKLADEARPPELCAEQVMAVAQAGETTIPYLSAYLLSFGSLRDLAEVLGPNLSPEGRYFVFCNNLDLSRRHRVVLGGATFTVLPIDEATVYNEMLDLLYLERGDLKKLDTAGKLDAIAQAAALFDPDFEPMSFEQGLASMGPVRNPNENRPV